MKRMSPSPKIVGENTHADVSLPANTSGELDQEDAFFSADILSSNMGLLSLHLADLRRCRIIKKAEYPELYRRIRAGEQSAFDEILVGNLRLVVSIAKRYRPNKQTILERISHGILGLYHAVSKFEPELGFSFSTYATIWVKQAIDRGITAESKLIRLPHHVFMKNNRYLRILHEREGKGLPALPDPKLKQELGFDSDSQLSQFKGIYRLETSIDATLPDSEFSIGDTLIDESEVLASEKTEQISNKTTLSRIMNDSLNPREQSILHMYYVLDMTLAEIGSVLSITTEGVRLARNEAVKRVKSKMDVMGLVFSDFI